MAYIGNSVVGVEHPSTSALNATTGAFTGNVTTTGVGSFGSLDISGDIDIDGTANLDVVDIDGAVDMASTLTVTGVSILNGGVDVSGDLTVDVDGGDIFFKDNSTEFGRITNAGGMFGLQVATQDQDLIVYMNDGGSTVEALKLDGSDAGKAIFNAGAEFASNVGIGTSAPDAGLHVASDAANFVARFYNDGNNVNRLGIFVQTGTDDGSGTVSFFDAYDGDGTATGKLVTISGTFQLTDTSDERLKQDIVDTTVSGLTSVNAMKVRDFAYKKNPTETIKAGFVAQELQTAFPSAVSYSEADDDKILSVSRERLVPVLVKAIQELSVKNDALEARITALEE